MLIPLLILHQATEYRKSFAAFLANATRLLELNGMNKDAFERRPKHDAPTDSNGQQRQKTGKSADLSDFIDAQENAKGTGGEGGSGGEDGGEGEAKEEQDEGYAGPATRMEKAMGASKA